MSDDERRKIMERMARRTARLAGLGEAVSVIMAEVEREMTALQLDREALEWLGKSAAEREAAISAEGVGICRAPQPYWRNPNEER